MTTHKIWYVPMMDSCGYTYCKFFNSEQEMEDFVESFEETDNEEEAPIGRQPGTSLEFEVNDLGEVVLPPLAKQ